MCGVEYCGSEEKRREERCGVEYCETEEKRREVSCGVLWKMYRREERCGVEKGQDCVRLLGGC